MKKILSVLLLICLCLPFCSCEKNEYKPSKGLSYELSSDGSYYTVVGIGSCKQSSIVVPSEHDGLPVCAIGDTAFKKTDITHVILPSTITTIAYDAFEDCKKLAFNEYGGASYLGTEDNKYFALISLSDDADKSFKINDSTKIVADCALWGASVEEISIPKSVANIGNASFYSCSSLKNVAMKGGISSISEEAFANCKKLGTISMPEGVETIEEKAFAYCAALESITLPSTIKYIGASAFSDCELLLDINFEGTMEQWNDVEKDHLWNTRTSFYTIHCTDGDIRK